MAYTLSDYLADARSYMEQGLFLEAFNALKSARKSAELDDSGRGQIAAIENEIETAQQKTAAALTTRLQDLIDRSAQTATKEGLQEGDTLLAQLEAVYGDPKRPNLSDLTRKWQEFRAKGEMFIEYWRVEKQVREIWGKGTWQRDEYEKARGLAEGLVVRYPGEEIVQELKADADKVWSVAVKKWEDLETGAGQGDFDAIFKAIKDEEASGKRDFPLYTWVKREGVKRLWPSSTSVSFDECMTELRKLAQEYDNKKVDEYMQKANAQLAEYDPLAAERWVQEAQVKKDEDGKKIGGFKYASEEKLQELGTFYQTRVKPKLDNRARAEALAHEALDNSGKDIESAWAFLQQAEGIDAHAPQNLSIREQLLPRMRLHLDGLQRDATDRLNVEGDFTVAAGKAERILGFARMQPGLETQAENAERLLEQCSREKTEFNRVREEAARIQSLAATDLDGATRDLQTLERDVARKPVVFQQLLQGARSAVESGLSISQLDAKWYQEFRDRDPGRDSAILASLLAFDVLDDVRKQQKEEALASLRNHRNLLKDPLSKTIDAERAKPGRRNAFAQIRAQVGKRIEFISGLLDWEAGLYEAARLNWKAVSESGMDDSQLATEWLARAMDATAVDAALKSARDHRQNNEFSEARKVLQPWLTKASPRQDDVRNLDRTVKVEWADDLEKRLKAQLQDPKEKDDFSLLAERINLLESLDADRAYAYKRDELLRVYEEWGDMALRNNALVSAAKWYEEAEKLAAKSERLVQKLFRVRQRQLFDQVDAERVGAAAEGLDKKAILSNWLQDHPDDVQVLERIVLLSLYENDAASAKRYMSRMRRALDAAEIDRNAFRADLGKGEEIPEWRLRLFGLDVQTEAVRVIQQRKKGIKEKLQAEKELRDYALARSEKESLLMELRGLRENLTNNRQKLSTEVEITPEACTRLTGDWDEKLAWLNTQLDEHSEDGVPEWFLQGEITLLRSLREVWARLPAVDSRRIDYRIARPDSQWLERWKTGLKIHFLQDGKSNEGEITLNEIPSGQGFLKDIVNELVNSPEGPRLDAQGNELACDDIPAEQLRWAENILNWIYEVGVITRAYHRETQQKGDSEAGDEFGPLHAALESFRVELGGDGNKLGFVQAIRLARANLNNVRSAGNIYDHQRGWQNVPWRSILNIILDSVTQDKDLQELKLEIPDFRQHLDDVDVDIRARAWETADYGLRSLGLVDAPEKILWDQIDHTIRQAGIDTKSGEVREHQSKGLDERWAEVLDPLQDYAKRFGAHRSAQCLRRDFREAEKTRKQLVLATCLLYVQHEAEEFRAALETMNRMDQLDSDDRFGFRLGVLVGGRKWGELRIWLEEQQRNWEQFCNWRDGIEHSVLPQWNGALLDAVRWFKSPPEPKMSVKGVIENLLQEAQFEEARKLAEDARQGKLSGGRTNTLGGGLSLKALREHMTVKKPVELEDKTKLSYRLRRALEQLVQIEHDLDEGITILDEWLGGEDVRGSIAFAEKQFQRKEEDMQAVLDSYRRAWFWQKNEYRGWCRETLKELSDLAPRYSKIADYEGEFEGK